MYKNKIFLYTRKYLHATKRSENVLYDIKKKGKNRIFIKFFSVHDNILINKIHK